MTMRVVHELPPERIYQACVKQFGVDWSDGVVWTYGNAVHSKYPIKDDSLIVHESVHSEQQKRMGVVRWWDQYLEDPQFRLEQEVEAYREQYAWIKENVRDRNMQAIRLNLLAKDLSGTMYGNLMSHGEAIKAIKHE